jgi:hypothetical protein
MTSGEAGAPPAFRLRPDDEPTEKRVIESCLKLLRRHGYKPERIHSGKFKTMDDRIFTGAEKGTPDYVCLHWRCRSFYLEFKRPGAILSELQRKKINDLRSIWRLPVAVVSDQEELSAWLAEHERGP